MWRLCNQINAGFLGVASVISVLDIAGNPRYVAYSLKLNTKKVYGLRSSLKGRAKTFPFLFAPAGNSSLKMVGVPNKERSKSNSRVSFGDEVRETYEDGAVNFIPLHNAPARIFRRSYRKSHRSLGGTRLLGNFRAAGPTPAPVKMEPEVVSQTIGDADGPTTDILITPRGTGHSEDPLGLMKDGLDKVSVYTMNVWPDFPGRRLESQYTCLQVKTAFGGRSNDKNKMGDILLFEKLTWSMHAGYKTAVYTRFDEDVARFNGEPGCFDYGWQTNINKLMQNTIVIEGEKCNEVRRLHHKVLCNGAAGKQRCFQIENSENMCGYKPYQVQDSHNQALDSKMSPYPEPVDAEDTIR